MSHAWLPDALAENRHLREQIDQLKRDQEWESALAERWRQRCEQAEAMARSSRQLLEQEMRGSLDPAHAPLLRVASQLDQMQAKVMTMQLRERQHLAGLKLWKAYLEAKAADRVRLLEAAAKLTLDLTREG